MKKLLTFGLIFVFIVSTLSGCGLFTPKSTQIAHGLVDLVMQPLNMADPAQREYSKDLTGDIEKLMNERSSKVNMTLSVKDYSGLDDLGVGDVLNGAELTIDSAYDKTNGDGSIQFNALNQVTGSVAIHEGAVALDFSELLGNIIIFNFESGLNFSRDVNYTARMEDIIKAINPQSGNTSEVLAEVQTLLYKYVEIAAKEIDPSNIESSKDELSIMGKDKKVEKQSITLDNNDMKNMVKAVLEVAVDDEDLADFIVKYYPDMYGEISDEDLKTQIQDSLEQALDSIDSGFEDDSVKVNIDLYFTYSGFLSNLIPGLPFQKKNPVAIDMELENDYTSFSAFYKFVKEGRAFDFSLSVDTGSDVIDVNLSNIRDGNEYTLKGDFEMPDGSYSVAIDGTTTLTSSSETSNYQLAVESNDPYGYFDTLSLEFDSELTQVKKGQSYELASTFSLDTTMQGSPISFVVGLDGTYEFSNEVEVDLPDFDDPDAIVYDSFDDLIADLTSGELFQGFSY